MIIIIHYYDFYFGSSINQVMTMLKMTLLLYQCLAGCGFGGLLLLLDDVACQ